ncbi:MAG: hydrogenase 4 subunit F [Magnetospirillum sp.]|nr:hydrogenase 4 subunit F [Magnetospirillum sp.]
MISYVAALSHTANPLLWILGSPLAGAALLALLPRWRAAAIVNVVVSGVTLAAALTLFQHRPAPTRLLFIDDFNIYLVALTAFVGFTTSVFSAAYIARETAARRLRPVHLRFYHSMYQAFLFTMLLALSANNTGVMWVAVEAATLTTVLMVSLYRTREAIEAAWKYFILCSVGIGLALFGTILVYLAAEPVMGDGADAMAWTLLIGRAAAFQPDLLNLAFVFVLVGYGTKVGLAPLHAWLPDAHAEGPTPISAVLSGLLLNVALYALLRFKMLIAANGHTLAPGPLMVMMGLSSLFLAGFMLYRRGDIKRLFAYSSIEHMGVITFTFGMGGAVANFAGLMHMTMHSLTKSAIFFAVGIISQNAGTKRIADIRGLTVSHPFLGWTFLLAVLAIAGLPPMGVFMSEFLVVSSTFARQPLLALPLALGLLLAFGALVSRVQGMAFGTPLAAAGHGRPSPMANAMAYAPLSAHMVLVVVAGLYLPPVLVSWFQTVAKLLG